MAMGAPITIVKGQYIVDPFHSMKIDNTIPDDVISYIFTDYTIGPKTGPQLFRFDITEEEATKLNIRKGTLTFDSTLKFLKEKGAPIIIEDVSGSIGFGRALVDPKFHMVIDAEGFPIEYMFYLKD